MTLTVATVRALVADQFPEWRHLPVRAVRAEGTDNAIFRIGYDLAARFRLAAEDPAVVRDRLKSEMDAARALAGRTRFPTPEPIALGEPGRGCPVPWLVQTWLPGATATEEDPGDSDDFARDLAEFIGGVRSIGTGGRRFSGAGRGGVLRTHDDWLETCFAHSEGLLDVPRLRALWAHFRDLPRGDSPDVTTHGDLIPGNILVRNGRLAGIIDVGGLGPADPALDLVCAWHGLEAGPREVLRVESGCSAEEWERGRAWAFAQAMGLVWYYVETNPVMCEIGRRTLDRVT